MICFQVYICTLSVTGNDLFSGVLCTLSVTGNDLFSGRQVCYIYIVSDR
jgi:hypothetical protein